MPTVFKHPDLPDYFLERPDVTAGDLAHIEPVLQPYENGRVLTFPNLKFDIDHDFWASLPTDAYPEVKKLPSRPPQVRGGKDDVLDRRLATAGMPKKLETELRRQIARVYEQVLPVYERLFAGYVFTRRQAVWRLNTIMNENMHVDTYKEVFPDHFARLFINLDTQPRIWHTSWPVAEIFARHAGKAPPEASALDADGFRTLVNRMAFGGLSSKWWDDEPRHVIYFQPGECWAVDSRQVAHQIFYGRRALSVDFFVDTASMKKPNRHYLAMAERLRRGAGIDA